MRFLAPPLLPFFFFFIISGSWSLTTLFPSLASYIVINPNSGPQNTSDPSGNNGGYCNVDTNADYIPHGCNRDWTTHLAALNKLSNAQTLGYVYTRYGARPLADTKADIAEWAAWYTAPTWTAGETVDIAVHGLWFDEIGIDPGNHTQYADLISYANTTFGARDGDNNDKKKNKNKNKRDRAAEYTVVLNAGPVANATYEAQLFGLASAVVTKETCYTSNPAATNVAWDCPSPYAPFAVESLATGDGLPHNRALLPQTVIIVHQFVGPPAATLQTLQEQLGGVVGLGVHSTYFTSGSWHQTTVAPATIGNVSKLLTAANEARRIAVGWTWVGWVPYACAFWHLQQTMGVYSY